MYAHTFKYTFHVSPAGIKPFPTDMLLSMFSLKNIWDYGRNRWRFYSQNVKLDVRIDTQSEIL